MPVSLNITEANVITVLGNFLTSVLPANTPVIRGQTNRTPQPANSNFVVMTPLFQERLAFNVDSLVQAAFTGSISGTTLTITAVTVGALAVGSSIYGPNVAANTVITALGSGTGGVGTYSVTPSQNAASGPFQAGTKASQQYTQVTVQVDVHGPASGDNAQVVTTLFRDEYCTTFFTNYGFAMDPLYTSDPRQTPFLDENQQVEERWTIDLTMEVDPIVTTPLQYATALGPVNIFEVI